MCYVLEVFNTCLRNDPQQIVTMKKILIANKNEGVSVFDY